MSTPAQAPNLRAVFKLKDFRKLWLAQFVSIFGDFLALFGVISLITFRLHGNVVQVTYVTIAFMLPLAFVGPVAGVFVDRWRVKRVMIASDVIRAFLALSLVWVTDVRQICVIFFLLSTVSAFFGPAQSVTLRTLVPKENLLAANAMMSQAFYTVRILSPLLAGQLVAWLTEKSCFYLDSFSFFFSAAMVGTLIILRPPTPPNPNAHPLKAFWSDLKAGNTFIYSHASLAFVVMAMTTAMFVMACFAPLISIYVRDSLAAGVRLYGVISSAVGVGLIVGTQVVNKVVGSKSKDQVVLMGLFALALAVSALGFFPNIPMAGVGTFGMGFAIAFIIVPAQTLMQTETPPAMIGRVSSSFMSSISFAQVFGMLLSGYLAQALGMRNLFKTCAVALAVISLLGYLRRRARTPLTPAPEAASD